MIKFFRKIRKRLLSENKVSRYMLYAIGEIILVVTGILIALQINNWNENRKLDIKEKGLLKELNLDFKSNKVQLDSIVLHNERSLFACNRVKELSKAFNPENPKVDATNVHLIDSLMRYHSKAYKNKSITFWEKKFNKLIGQTRFKVERTFGGIKRWFNGGETRYRGMDKIHTQNLMEALCYNLDRRPGIIAYLIVKIRGKRT